MFGFIYEIIQGCRSTELKIRLEVFGSLYLRDRARSPVSLLRAYLWQMFGSLVPKAMQTMPNVCVQ